MPTTRVAAAAALQAHSSLVFSGEGGGFPARRIGNLLALPYEAAGTTGESSHPDRRRCAATAGYQGITPRAVQHPCRPARQGFTTTCIGSGAAKLRKAVALWRRSRIRLDVTFFLIVGRAREVTSLSPAMPGVSAAHVDRARCHRGRARTRHKRRPACNDVAVKHRCTSSDSRKGRAPADGPAPSRARP